MAHILVIEDDQSVARLIKLLLENEGFTASLVHSAKDAKDILKNDNFNLILLDINLPDGSGYSVCSHIKQTSNIPVIFISALSDEADIITGFNLGADDYITKPFHKLELIARVKNALKHNSKNNNIFKYGNITINTLKNTVTKNGSEVNLSALEQRIWLTFMNNENVILTRDKLLDIIWDAAGNFVNDNTLTVCIKRLREKIEDDPANPKIIKTIRGIGYKLGDVHENK